MQDRGITGLGWQDEAVVTQQPLQAEGRPQAQVSACRPQVLETDRAVRWPPAR